MITLPVPAALNGDVLEDELAAAGFDADVYVSGGDLVVSGLDEADRDAVQAVIDAHVPPDPGPSKDDLLAQARTKAESLPSGAAKDALLALVSAIE